MALKQCKKCSLYKEEKAFYTKRTSCKECEKKYQKEYQYSKKELVYSQMTARRLAKKQKAIYLKGNKCFDCLHSFPSYVYDFHHLDPNNKELDPAKLWQRSWNKIEEELNKCILLCANCHRKRHYNEET